MMKFTRLITKKPRQRPIFLTLVGFSAASAVTGLILFWMETR